MIKIVVSPTRTCPKCGAKFPGGALEGLCPACVGRFIVVPAAVADEASTSSAAAGPKPRLRYFGDYELQEEVARGGMGVVHKARQLSLNRTVAVKMILGGQLASVVDVQRFRAEAEAAANLRHPNIVSIYEVGEHDGQHFFSMDYVEGRNLAEESAKCGVRSPAWCRRAAGYVRTIAEAIHYAHQQGTLHRDLKPSNILIDEANEPHITDFGLAKRVKSDSDLTVTGQVLGTPNFMPPEQASGKRGAIGPYSDVYSLGAVLYFLLAGKPPFVADTVHETLSLVATAEPVAPRTLNPAVPRDLQTICLKCLEKEPRARYASAKDLAEDLSRFFHDEPIRARAIMPAQRLWRVCRRHKLVFALSAAVVVVPILVAALVSRFKGGGALERIGGPSVASASVAPLPERCGNGICGIIDGKIYVTSANDGYPGVRKSLYIYDTESNQWSRLADSSSPHGSPAGGVISGKFYVAGGADWHEGVDAYLKVLEVYDPRKAAWTVKAPMPTARCSCASAVLDGKLYVIGGWDGTNCLSTVESYDPASDHWASEPPLQIGRRGCGTAVIEGMMYVVGGGINSSNQLAGTIEKWKPGGQWTIVPTGGPMETPVFNPFVAAINGSLYVAGGTSATGGSDALQIFLPHWTSTFGIWQTRTPMPEIRAQGCGAAVLGDDLYVLGGWAERPSGDGLPHRDVFVFESRRNRWRPSRPSEDEKKMPSLPTRSAQGIAGVIDGKVYVTTGARGVAGEWPGFLHVYDPKPNFWKQLASSAMPHVSGAGGVIRGKLYLTGGLCRIGGEYKDGGMTEAYDPSSNTWTSKRSMPTARGTCASVVLSNKLYVIGGHDGTNRVTVVESYDPAADEWASEPSLLRARDGCGAAVVNGVIYVFSGVVDRTGKPAEVMETWRPGGKWTAKVIETPMPFAVSCAFVAVVNDRIYVAGGSTQRRSTAETQAYRPENNWWGSIRPMPEARYLGSGTAVLNDEIYCFGGWDDLPGSEQLPHADVFVYNILLNQWRRSSSSNPAGN